MFLSVRLERLLDGEGSNASGVVAAVRVGRMHAGNEEVPAATHSDCTAAGLASLMHAVDDYKFKFENVATYWLSWTDPGAEAAIRARTAEVASEPAGEGGASSSFEASPAAPLFPMWKGANATNTVLNCPSCPAACRRPCSNRVADVRCCDAIFLPSIYSTNADAFPEDREIGYSIDTTANGAVVWESTVHAFFYQVGWGWPLAAPSGA